MKQHSQSDGRWTGNEGFSHVPTAPDMKAEEGKLDIHFYIISPQFAPEARQINTRNSCRCCSGGHGDGICSYHANKTRRFKQRLSHISRTNRQRINWTYQLDNVEAQLTLSDIFGGLAGCFSIPLGGMAWLVWFSSASFAVSMAYWTTVALVTLIASCILWLKWS